ncbi:hypothetical protein F4780DRAFT_402474 [Xylariomycetidae sp. FL0641]|nr:hypothetical protein F4780DRAFT_402474 [Xylariomycetidae sp. FL0641]
MPAAASGNGVAATSGKQFELPALNFKFGSLTEGTDIPPPLPSPKETPALPKTPVKDEQPRKPSTTGALNGHPASPRSDITSTTNGVTKSSAEDGPVSPALSNRGSLRRLLSKTLLNNTYDEHGSITGQNASRPPSRTASTITEEKKSKRSSGWFRRLRLNEHTDNNHHETHQNNIRKASSASTFEEPKKPLGPPPPMIPELNALETKVDTRLGDDLFKEIGKTT